MPGPQFGIEWLLSLFSVFCIHANKSPHLTMLEEGINGLPLTIDFGDTRWN